MAFFALAAAAAVSTLPILATAQITIGDSNVDITVHPEGFLQAVQGKGQGARGRLYGEGWGAGVRRNGVFLDECGATDNTLFGSGLGSTNVRIDRFRGEDGGTTADSRVDCGETGLLRVRHQFRSARRRDGCKGAYEVKVTVENRACGTLPEVVYRRNNDFDTNFDTQNFFTIKGVDAEEPEVELASNSLFCDVLPSTPCPNVQGVTLPATNAGPFDQGSVFQINIGMLKKGESATFHMYYGAFDSPADAEECVDGARMDTYSLSQAQNKKNTFLFGFRRSLAVGSFSSTKKCINWDTVESAQYAAPFATTASYDDMMMKKQAMMTKK